MEKYEIAKQAYKKIVEAIVEIEEKNGILCDLPTFIEVGGEKFYRNELHHFSVRRNKTGKIKIE